MPLTALYPLSSLVVTQLGHDPSPERVAMRRLPKGASHPLWTCV